MTLREGHRDLPAEAPTKHNRVRQPDREGKSRGHVRQPREGAYIRLSPGVPGPGKVENGHAVVTREIQQQRRIPPRQGSVLSGYEEKIRAAPEALVRDRNHP